MLLMPVGIETSAIKHCREATAPRQARNRTGRSRGRPFSFPTRGRWHRELSFFAICNLYSLTRSTDAVRKLFRVSSNRAAAIEPRDAIFPGHNAAVVREAEEHPRRQGSVVFLAWLWHPQWSGVGHIWVTEQGQHGFI